MSPSGCGHLSASPVVACAPSDAQFRARTSGEASRSHEHRSASTVSPERRRRRRPIVRAFLSSGEEARRVQETYACCSFRDRLVALDFEKPASIQWKTFTINPKTACARQEKIHRRPIARTAVERLRRRPPSTKSADLSMLTGDSYTDLPTRARTPRWRLK